MGRARGAPKVINKLAKSTTKRKYRTSDRNTCGQGLRPGKTNLLDSDILIIVQHRENCSRLGRRAAGPRLALLKTMLPPVISDGGQPDGLRPMTTLNALALKFELGVPWAKL